VELLQGALALPRKAARCLPALVWVASKGHAVQAIGLGRLYPIKGRAGAVYRPNVVRVGSEDAPLAARAREVWVDGLIRRYLDMDPGEWTYRYQARLRCSAAQCQDLCRTPRTAHRAGLRGMCWSYR